VLLACCAFLLLAGCEPDGITRDWHPVEPPVPAPDFSLQRLDGPAVSLKDLRGSVVVLEFWATWCGPCRGSLPSLEVIARRYRDRRVQVLLVNVAEQAEPVRAWLEGRYEAAAVLLDGDGGVSERYGVDGIPRLFVIDQDGRVVWSHQGYGGGLERNLTMILDQLLSGHG
jgi:thiol-disulfide isomerase/thioredoxin